MNCILAEHRPVAGEALLSQSTATDDEEWTYPFVDGFFPPPKFWMGDFWRPDECISDNNELYRWWVIFMSRVLVRRMILRFFWGSHQHLLSKRKKLIGTCSFCNSSVSRLEHAVFFFKFYALFRLSGNIAQMACVKLKQQYFHLENLDALWSLFNCYGRV